MYVPYINAQIITVAKSINLTLKDFFYIFNKFYGTQSNVNNINVFFYQDYNYIQTHLTKSFSYLTLPYHLLYFSLFVVLFHYRIILSINSYLPIIGDLGQVTK